MSSSRRSSSSKKEKELYNKLAKDVLDFYGNQPPPDIHKVFQMAEEAYLQMYKNTYNTPFLPKDIIEKIYRYSKEPNMLLLSKDYVKTVSKAMSSVNMPLELFKSMKSEQTAIYEMDNGLDPYQMITRNSPSPFKHVPLIYILINSKPKIARAIIEHPKFPNKNKEKIYLYYNDRREKTDVGITLLFSILISVYCNHKNDEDGKREYENIFEDTILHTVHSIIEDGGVRQGNIYIPTESAVEGKNINIEEFVETFIPSPAVVGALFSLYPTEAKDYYKRLASIEHPSDYHKNVLEALKKEGIRVSGGRKQTKKSKKV